MDDHPDNIMVNSAGYHDQEELNDVRNPTNEPSPTSGIGSGSRNHGTIDDQHWLCGGKEVVTPDRTGNDEIGTGSYPEGCSSDSVDAVDMNSGMMQFSSSSSLSYGDSHLDGLCIENQMAEVPTELVSDLDMDQLESASPLASHSQGIEPLQSFIPSGIGFLVSNNREQGQDGGNVVHLDMVTFSSGIPYGTNSETSSPEAGRNDRRLFWDAFARRSSRSRLEASAIVLSTDDNDNRIDQNSWLLGLSNQTLYDSTSNDSRYLGGRIPRMAEPQQHSRFEIWERLRSVLDDDVRRSSLCSSGLHPNGSCSCESLSMTGESSAHASISRIIMLAEALFEVLDEIQRHPPTSLSFSAAVSAVSLPAPESVVDSFPVKNHAKLGKLDGGDDVEQCNICLSEYEEGEKIRILPCHHEYHMSCVDKWLKEIHGVCPLCRGDVCEGVNESSSLILVE